MPIYQDRANNKFKLFMCFNGIGFTKDHKSKSHLSQLEEKIKANMNWAFIRHAFTERRFKFAEAVGRTKEPPRLTKVDTALKAYVVETPRHITRHENEVTEPYTGAVQLELPEIEDAFYEPPEADLVPYEPKVLKSDKVRKKRIPKPVPAPLIDNMPPKVDPHVFEASPRAKVFINFDGEVQLKVPDDILATMAQAVWEKYFPSNHKVGSPKKQIRVVTVAV